MSIWEFIVLLVVAGVCGSIAQALTGFSRGGCLVSIALGFIGALLGGWLARYLGLPELFAIQKLAIRRRIQLFGRSSGQACLSLFWRF